MHACINHARSVLTFLPLRLSQTLAQWEASVDAAIASGAAHVSVYDLQVSPYPSLATSYQKQPFPIHTNHTLNSPPLYPTN